VFPLSATGVDVIAPTFERPFDGDIELPPPPPPPPELPELFLSAFSADFSRSERSSFLLLILSG